MNQEAESKDSVFSEFRIPNSEFAKQCFLRIPNSEFRICEAVCTSCKCKMQNSKFKMNQEAESKNSVFSEFSSHRSEFRICEAVCTSCKCKMQNSKFKMNQEAESKDSVFSEFRIPNSEFAKHRSEFRICEAVFSPNSEFRNPNLRSTVPNSEFAKHRYQMTLVSISSETSLIKSATDCTP